MPRQSQRAIVTAGVFRLFHMFVNVARCPELGLILYPSGTATADDDYCVFEIYIQNAKS